MNNKDLYQEKKQAQLNEWKAQINKFKAQAALATVDAKIEMNKQIKILEGKMDEGKVKLSELNKATESTFESVKKNVETAYESVKTTFTDAAKKFKS